MFLPLFMARGVLKSVLHRAQLAALQDEVLL